MARLARPPRLEGWGSSVAVSCSWRAKRELDALAVGGEGLLSVAALDGAVEALVRFDELGRHGPLARKQSGAITDLVPGEVWHSSEY